VLCVFQRADVQIVPSGGDEVVLYCEDSAKIVQYIESALRFCDSGDSGPPMTPYIQCRKNSFDKIGIA